jgi:hypothetical protein
MNKCYNTISWSRRRIRWKTLKQNFEEWWEVAEEYFMKELEKNLAQHKPNERILKYKLETYQKIFHISSMVIQ